MIKADKTDQLIYFGIAKGLPQSLLKGFEETILQSKTKESRTTLKDSKLYEEYNINDF